jgi:acyl-CoA synthetase (AMP-forming)/AMP-acid ligase II
VTSFSIESLGKLQNLRQDLAKPVLRDPNEIKKFADSLGDNLEAFDSTTICTSGGEVIDNATMAQMRERGGSYEYSKNYKGIVETRKDRACETEIEARAEINGLLQSFDPRLSEIDITSKINWDNPEKRIRLPKYGMEIRLSKDNSYNDKYNIYFLGKIIGEILYHDHGHDHLAGEKDANALLPHYNIVLKHHPNYGNLHGHINFTK